MQTKPVDKLPICSECQASERTTPNDATFTVLTPMKMRLNLCDEHFFDYVTNRLGSQTVTQLVVASKPSKRAA